MTCSQSLQGRPRSHPGTDGLGVEVLAERHLLGHRGLLEADAEPLRLRAVGAEQLLEVLGLGVVALLLLLCGELGALTPDTTQICGARAVQAYDLLYILYYAHVAMRLRRTRARTLSL
jgi:hypothetical protein